MFSDLLNKVRTKAEAEFLVSEIELLLESLYEFGDRGFDNVLKTRVRAWAGADIEILIKEGGGAKKEFLEKLKKRIDELSIVNLKVAWDPTDDALDKFYSKLKEFLGDNLLINLEVDPKIVGGAIISYMGIYKDFSVAKLLKDSGPEIEEIIKDKLHLDF